jgi:hypothetical protein
MPKKKKVAPEAEAGKSISAQLSDLRSENRAIKKLYNGQQAQMNEMQSTIKILWERIGN